MTQQLLIKSKTDAWYMTKNSNVLLFSTAFTNDIWIDTNATLVAGQTDPVAGTDAVTFTASANDATLIQPVWFEGDPLNRVFSIYIKRNTGSGAVSITADGATYEVKVVSGAWSRYDVTAVTSGNIQVGIKLAVSGDSVYVYGAQMEDGVSPTTYVTNLANQYTVTQIIDADFPVNTTRGCAFLDGRFFVMNSAGEIYQSALEDASSWSALEFIQSQIDPSQGVYLAKVQNYVTAFKEWSIEFFYDAANPVGSILSPVQNTAIQIGCASDNSVQDINGTIIFMGQTRAGFGRSIYFLNGTTPQKISTSQVEKILDSDDLSQVYSWQALVGSHMLYGITLVDTGVTLVYDMSSQLWSFFTYLTLSGALKDIDSVSATGTVTSVAHGFSDGDIVEIKWAYYAGINGWHIVTNVTADTFDIQYDGNEITGYGSVQKYTETYFPITASVRSGGRQFMQDATSGSLYELNASEYRDAVGAIAARLRTPKIDDQTANNKTMSQAELIGDKIASTATIRWSDDDYVTYSEFRPVDLNAKRSRIRRLGDYNRRAFEILHVKNALLRISGIDLV